MPAIVKPCEGFFSEEADRVLTKNCDRAQWLPHRCERCGKKVDARLVKGRWCPEVHWPSVPRRAARRPVVGSARSPLGERNVDRSGLNY